MSHYLSLCLCMCLSVGYKHEPCKNGWTNQGSICAENLRGQGTMHCRGPSPQSGRPNFMGGERCVLCASIAVETCVLLSPNDAEVCVRLETLLCLREKEHWVQRRTSATNMSNCCWSKYIRCTEGWARVTSQKLSDIHELVIVSCPMSQTLADYRAVLLLYDQLWAPSSIGWDAVTWCSQ